MHEAPWLMNGHSPRLSSLNSSIRSEVPRWPENAPARGHIAELSWGAFRSQRDESCKIKRGEIPKGVRQ